MITCEHASRLVSDRLQHHLGLRDAATLRLHLMLCNGCRRFARQMRWLRTFLAAERDAPGALEPAEALGESARERILARLRGA